MLSRFIQGHRWRFLAFLLGTMHALGDAIGILQFHQSVPASIADANSDVTRILLSYTHTSLLFWFRTAKIQPLLQ